MPDHTTSCFRNERDRELAGFAKRLDNELLRVARVRRVLESGDRYGFNRSNIGGGLTADRYVHRFSAIAGRAQLTCDRVARSVRY